MQNKAPGKLPLKANLDKLLQKQLQKIKYWKKIW